MNDFTTRDEEMIEEKVHCKATHQNRKSLLWIPFLLFQIYDSVRVLNQLTESDEAMIHEK